MRTGLLTILFCVLMLSAFAQNHMGHVPNAVIGVGTSANPDFVFDGNFDVSKYNMSANVTFSIDGTLKISSTEAFWGVYRDADHVVIGVMTPTGGELITTKQQHDTHIWNDDSYEIYLLTRDGKNGYHFIFNSGKGLFDASMKHGSHDVKWNGEGVEFKNQVKNGNWSAEIRIPLKSLPGLNGHKIWKMGIYRSAQGKRTNEGIGQNRNDSYYDIASFVELHWTPGLSRYGYVLDIPALIHGTLGGELTLPQGNQKDMEWEIGVAPLRFDVNDGYNKSVETLKKSGKVSSGKQKIELGKLPDVGTIRMALMQDGKKMYKRFLPYDRQKFSQLKISSVWVGGNDLQTLFANVNTITRSPYEFALLGQDQKPVSVKKGMISSASTLTLPLAGVKPGVYTLLIRLFSEDGKEIQRDSGPFTVLERKPAWLGNSLGKTAGKVPAPWTPIRIDSGKNVHIWGRVYSLDNGGLPQAMKGIAGVGATDFSFIAGGKRFVPESFKWIKQAADESVFESVFKLGNSRIYLKGSVEFDGLMWLASRIVPGKGETLPDLDFCFDVSAANSNIVYSGEHMAVNSGSLSPEKSWSKDLLNQVPMFWIGNDRGGTGFFVDDLRGWNLKDYKKTVEISAVREGKRKVTVHLLSGAMNKRDKSYELEFALQMTPVKPLPKGWRNFQINGGQKKNLQFYGRFTKYFNAPLPLQKGAKQRLDANKKKGIRTPVYLAFNAISSFIPEYSYFSEEWRVVPQQRPRFHDPDFITHTFICPRGKGFNDYYLYKLDQMVDELDADGLYFDYAQPNLYACSNRQHGCEWVDNFGGKHSSIRMKASRELAKRIYVYFREKRPNGVIVHHNSGGMLIPFHGFCDITWNGEQTTSNLIATNLHYSKFMNVDRCRIEQRHEPWGVVVCFLPQYLRAVDLFNKDYFGDRKKLGWTGVYNAFEADPGLTRDTWYLAGLTLINDSMFSGDWGMWSRLENLTAIFEKLGWNDSVEFFGYFNPANPFRKVAPADPAVLVSAYKAPKGYLVTIFNDSRTDCKVKIRLPQEITKIYHAVTKKPLQIENGTVSVDVLSKNPTLLMTVAP